MQVGDSAELTRTFTAADLAALAALARVAPAGAPPAAVLPAGALPGHAPPAEAQPGNTVPADARSAGSLPAPAPAGPTVPVGAMPLDRVPEPLLAALISCLLGVRLPGPGTNYLKQELAYPAPAPLGVPLTARVELVRLRPEKRLADLWASCRTAEGVVVAQGRALVKYAGPAPAD